MDTIIAGGKIVTPEKVYRADIGISSGKIKAIAANLKISARQTIDASGMLIFPGIIDAHTHYQLDTGAMTTAEDFADGTRAAACGGVTTIVDFAVQEKGHSLDEAIEKRRRQADDRVAVDYSLHAVPTDWNEKTRREIKKLISGGISSFKMFMIYAKAGLMSNDAAIFSALEETAKFGGMVTVHAESASVLDLLIERYHNIKDMKRYGAYCHTLSRPNFVEAEAVARAITWAEATGGRLYIVHLSTKDGVELVRAGKRRGVKVYAETCPQYLLLDDSVFKRRDGHLYATCPQVKKRADIEALWDGLADGTVSVIATDNCTFTKAQKGSWHGDFTKIPYGLPGSETLLPLMYSFGVGRKRISLQRMVKLLCANPAKLMGLYPRKGAIAEGSDADLVIFDPDKKVTLSHKNLQTNCDWSPYEGFKLKGYPVMTICRGEIVARGGEPVSKRASGRFLKRKSCIDL